jgi:hypothetical protein
MTLNAVASFAAAPYKRLLAIQLVFALGAAVAAIWTLRVAWIPGIEEAISRLPDRGAIRNGNLQWEKDAFMQLTESSFLSIWVDVEGTVEVSRIADLGLELQRDHLEIHSLFGNLDVRYPIGWRVALNRPELEPWWGAWKPFVLLGIGLGIVFWIFLSWHFLAFLYVSPIRLLAFYQDRDVTWMGCWRLAAASLLPGSAVMTGAILFYGLQRLNLLGLLIAAPLHIVIGWVYAALAPARLATLPSVVSARENPFSGPAAAP